MSTMTVTTDAELDEPQPAWLIVRPWQMVALSIASYGLYLLYWQFEQWSALRNASLRVAWGQHRDIQPYWRGYLSVLFLYPLFAAIRDDLRARGAAAFRPWLLVAAYFLVPWLGTPLAALFVPSPLPLVFWALGLVPLVVVQRALNAANERRGATADPYAEMTALHWTVLIGGGLMVVREVVGALAG
jgi:hypothetical protein